MLSWENLLPMLQRKLILYVHRTPEGVINHPLHLEEKLDTVMRWIELKWANKNMKTHENYSIPNTIFCPSICAFSTVKLAHWNDVIIQKAADPDSLIRQHSDFLHSCYNQCRSELWQKLTLQAICNDKGLSGIEAPSNLKTIKINSKGQTDLASSDQRAYCRPQRPHGSSIGNAWVLRRAACHFLPLASEKRLLLCIIAKCYIIEKNCITRC